MSKALVNFVMNVMIKYIILKNFQKKIRYFLEIKKTLRIFAFEIVL